LRPEQSVPRFDPCLPRPASEPPAGPGWIHEIKHDGFRILAHRRGRAVRLFSRNGHNFGRSTISMAESRVDVVTTFGLRHSAPAATAERRWLAPDRFKDFWRN
jgi:hypothetical protein